MKTIKTFLRNSKKENSYLLLQNQTNVKQTWQVPNETSGTKKLKLDSFPKKLKIKEKHKIKPYKNANELNKFFTGIGPNLASNIANITKSFKSYLVPF